MDEAPARKVTRASAQKLICQQLSEGVSLRSILGTAGMPASSTVFRWLAADDAFREQYAHAREAQADAIFDEILDIADDGSNDWMERRREDGSTELVLNYEHVQRSKLRVDTRKWMAARLAPKKYGDDLRLRHADADGEKLEMSDTARAARLASIFATIIDRSGESD